MQQRSPHMHNRRSQKQSSILGVHENFPTNQLGLKRQQDCSGLYEQD